MQVHGQKLQVSGIGNLDIEWYLGGDLKTLKCMLGFKGGANTLFPCIFLLNLKTPSKGKGKILKASKTIAHLQPQKGKASKKWKDGILSCD